MFNFQYFLTAIGLDLTRVRMVRHQAKAPVGRRPYDLWVAKSAGNTEFESYQSVQGQERFAKADWVASFVATPLNETLFAGLYQVSGCGIAPPGTIDPVGLHDVSGLFLYDLKYDGRLSEYEGRLVIEWGQGARAWVQRACTQEKKVLEMRRDQTEPPFPGFAKFRWPIKALDSVPASWRSTLTAVSGIYLLTCAASGKQYVGSASGQEGFWGRWQNYFQNGHGGNQDMKSHQNPEYQVSILEYTSVETDLRAAESMWKDKLMTRQFGLNLN